jgi:hypothetical protein
MIWKTWLWKFAIKSVMFIFVISTSIIQWKVRSFANSFFSKQRSQEVTYSLCLQLSCDHRRFGYRGIQGCMAIGIHGLPKILQSPNKPKLSTPSWWPLATPEIASWPFQGWLRAGRAAFSHLISPWIAHAVCLWKKSFKHVGHWQKLIQLKWSYTWHHFVNRSTYDGHLHLHSDCW